MVMLAAGTVAPALPSWLTPARVTDEVVTVDSCALASEAPGEITNGRAETIELQVRHVVDEHLRVQARSDESSPTASESSVVRSDRGDGHRRIDLQACRRDGVGRG